ncbi:MAG: permease, partial [Verrucomicrobiae bacterium]|nr:permease [Verrucomicrobiae bacterium]
MNTLRNDLVYAVRSLMRQRGYCAIVVLTLALGIGGVLAISSTVQSLLFRALPFKDADQLVRITSLRGERDGTVAVPELEDLKALSVVEDAALYTDQGMYNASGDGGPPEELAATICTANLFRVLGTMP